MSEGIFEPLDPKKQKLLLLEEKRKRELELPHLYGWKDYKWSREFIECNHRTQLLCAANQIGKSSSQIRKMVTLAVDKNQWPKFFRRTPRLFWYMYPTSQFATIEFRTKWVPDILPKGSMKDHPVYGWKETYRNRGDIFSIDFNSGVSIYFKTYAQDESALQGATVDYIACDEELVGDLWDEVNMRRNASDGMFSMVFTATLGQDLWRRAMEPTNKQEEFLPEAWKKNVSLFDCVKFEDGTPSHWTTEKINRTVAMCKSQAEVLKRVYGRFVQDSGLKYQMFDRQRNAITPFAIPSNWIHYCGIDLGTGGEENHPSTITFVAVRPDYKYGVVYKHWRGDKDKTSMTDVANQYMVMREYNTISGSFYDYASSEFKLITERMGLGFMPANKSHTHGEQIINALFKNKMLDIFDTPECEPIFQEFMSLLISTDKRKAKDDSVDSVRYGVTRIPWDWSHVGLDMQMPEVAPRKKVTDAEQAQIERERDRKRMFDNNFQDSLSQSIEKELTEWSDTYEI